MHHWPLFDLVIRTPTLELRYIDDESAAGLMEIAAIDGVHPPDFMPFSSPWTRFEPPKLQEQGMQHFWRVRSETSAAKWELPFAVHHEGQLVGSQGLGGTDFAVTRWFVTGSWLGRSHQGQGIGKEMRAAVLHLGFAGLGAEHAATEAWHDNAASVGVTRSLGYTPNGFDITTREGKADRHLRFVLARADWESRRRGDITIEGLEPCLPLLGLA